MIVKREQVAREVEVAVGSIWAVHQKAWYRANLMQYKMTWVGMVWPYHVA